jgi:hypothetical protein
MQMGLFVVPDVTCGAVDIQGEKGIPANWIEHWS